MPLLACSRAVSINFPLEKDPKQNSHDCEHEWRVHELGQPELPAEQDRHNDAHVSNEIH